MGEFVKATALRTNDLNAVQAGLLRHGRIRDDAEGDELRTSASVWAPVNGWTVAIWPRWFTDLSFVSPKLSADLGTLASAIDVYDGNFWTHQLWRDGVELDRFSSSPEHFAQSRAELRRLRQEWAGRPDVIANAFGVNANTVARYLIPPYTGFFGRLRGRRKPFPDDATTLDDVWIFVDFWRRLGITSFDGTPPARTVRLPTLRFD
ncbi:hypothetical protein [Paractinoplanes atraurantiacus]|uniref:Uncharacterized protein n=1 Tax=Paractinoplanes atraurantiacus TaxID=1036182 RepID=A0A285KCH0_9ACTN|nr:hypothetical protein [Actinoplanes atraurantiacus]SNY70300.1 hypothetical protein SAMN05421748_13757 [Actinoplanes atraurantiacus]